MIIMTKIYIYILDRLHWQPVGGASSLHPAACSLPLTDHPVALWLKLLCWNPICSHSVDLLHSPHHYTLPALITVINLSTNQGWQFGALLCQLLGPRYYSHRLCTTWKVCVKTLVFWQNRAISSKTRWWDESAFNLFFTPDVIFSSDQCWFSWSTMTSQIKANIRCLFSFPPQPVTIKWLFPSVTRLFYRWANGWSISPLIKRINPPLLLAEWNTLRR